MPDENAVNVMLDPGLAFGTGTHPTTALCLEWLDGLDLKDKSVIDFGCGSGILAIAALKLGAKSAVGIDIDPQAILASRNNAEQNGVADRLQLFLSDEKPSDLKQMSWWRIFLLALSKNFTQSLANLLSRMAILVYRAF